MSKDQWEELLPEERQERLDAIAQRENEALKPRGDDGPETNDDDDHQHIDVEDCFDCPFYESHLMFHECVLDGDVEPDGVILPDDCPLRTRSVVVHGVWEKEQTPDEGEEEYVGVGLVNPRHVEQFKLRAESLKEPAKQPEVRVLRRAMTLLYQAMVHMRSLGVKTGLGGIEQATSILEELEEIMQHSDAYEQGYKHGLVDGERQAHGVKPHGPRKKDESK